MSHIKVECLICQKILECAKGNIDGLIEHLNASHSKSEVLRYLSGHTAEPKQRKSSVFKWTPEQTIICQHCKKEGKPVIKKKEVPPKILNKTLSNFLWCWPMCCYKMFQKKSKMVCTHCPHCNKYIGLYNPYTGLIARATE